MMSVLKFVVEAGLLYFVLVDPGIACNVDNGGCQHACNLIGDSGPICSCRLGYLLNSTDLKSCFGSKQASYL